MGRGRGGRGEQTQNHPQTWMNCLGLNRRPDQNAVVSLSRKCVVTDKEDDVSWCVHFMVYKDKQTSRQWKDSENKCLPTHQVLESCHLCICNTHETSLPNPESHKMCPSVKENLLSILIDREVNE